MGRTFSARVALSLVIAAGCGGKGAAGPSATGPIAAPIAPAPPPNVPGFDCAGAERATNVCGAAGSNVEMLATSIMCAPAPATKPRDPAWDRKKAPQYLDLVRRRFGLSADDEKHLEEFRTKAFDHLAIDHSGALVYLAPSRVNLELTIERWPKIKFRDTREHQM